MKLHVSWDLRARTCQPESNEQTDRKPTKTNVAPIAGSFGYKQGFGVHFKSILSYILKLCQKKTVSKLDEFDEQFGFILKHNIDSKENYNKVKLHHSQYRQASLQNTS